MKLLFFLLGLLFCFSVFGQNPTFKVLLTEGNNTFGQNQFITIGSKIPDNQVINMQGEYLALVDSEGKSIEITEKGIYKGKEIRERAKKAKFIKTKLPLPQVLESLHEKKVLKPLNLCRCYSPIRLLGNHETYLYQSTLRIDWYYKSRATSPTHKIEKYVVYFTNMYGTILKQIETQENFYVISNEIFGAEEAIIYKVMAIHKNKVVNPDEDGHAILKMTEENYRKVTQDLQNLKNIEAPLLSQLILANYFEEQDLLIDARLAYIKLLEMKDLAIFQTLYQNFLYRNRLTQEVFGED